MIFFICSSYHSNFVTRLQIGNEVIQHNIAFVGDLQNKARLILITFLYWRHKTPSALKSVRKLVDITLRGPGIC